MNKGEDLKIPVLYQDKVLSDSSNFFSKIIMQKLGCNYLTFCNLTVTELRFVFVWVIHFIPEKLSL